jgi:hypothetical protein
MHGNISELHDGGGSPGKSCLFFLTCYHRGIGLTGDTVACMAKHLTS